MCTHNICFYAWRGDSNEYPQHMFLWRKTIAIPKLSSNTLLIFSIGTHRSLPFQPDWVRIWDSLTIVRCRLKNPHSGWLFGISRLPSEAKKSPKSQNFQFAQPLWIICFALHFLGQLHLILNLHNFISWIRNYTFLSCLMTKPMKKRTISNAYQIPTPPPPQ